MKLPKFLRSKLKTRQTKVNKNGNSDGVVDRPEEESQKVFVYRGQSQGDIPSDIIHATVHPWTRKIKKFAFQSNNSESSSLEKWPYHRESRKGCTSLVELHLNRGLKCLKREAFHSCHSLTGKSGEHEGAVEPTLSIPATVETVGPYAFAHCNSLVNVSFQGEGRLQRLEQGVFCNCTSLAHVELPLGLEDISHDVFSGCISLVDIELRIGERAFEYCTSLNNVAFPQGFVCIGERGFAGCTSLVEVQFQEGLKTVRSEAFRGCTALSAVAFPSTIFDLWFRVFADCTSLLGVEFPRSCTFPAHVRNLPMYDESLFSGCTSLVNLSLSGYVLSETDAFPGCDLLQDYGAGVKDRYARFPVHQVCYNSSSATVDHLIRALDSSEIMVDDFGLTPFHIVATSANPKVETLECLLDRYSFDILCQRDHCGKTMLDYLLMHTSSKVVPLIQTVLQKSVFDRLSEWDIGAKWGSILSQNLESIPRESGIGGADGRRKRVYDDFFRDLGHCMRTEMTSILELALWKSRLHTTQKDEGGSDDDFREICHAQSGALVVIQNVAEHLWYDETKSSTALSIFPVCSTVIN
mmetsp:Transcript_40337/g.97405  ORF Transcript_40337/g.97405 Transcript_40337/m.97405 type:complete len:580 (-) Transcript_40337:26-1765(-)